MHSSATGRALRRRRPISSPQFTHAPYSPRSIFSRAASIFESSPCSRSRSRPVNWRFTSDEAVSISSGKSSGSTWMSPERARRALPMISSRCARSIFLNRSSSRLFNAPPSARPQEVELLLRLDGPRRVRVFANHPLERLARGLAEARPQAQQRLALPIQRVRCPLALRVTRDDVVESQHRGLVVAVLEVAVRHPVRGVVGVRRRRVSLQEVAELVNARLRLARAPR